MRILYSMMMHPSVERWGELLQIQKLIGIITIAFQYIFTRAVRTGYPLGNIACGNRCRIAHAHTRRHTCPCISNRTVFARIIFIRARSVCIKPRPAPATKCYIQNGKWVQDDTGIFQIEAQGKDLGCYYEGSTIVGPPIDTGGVEIIP